MHLMITAYAVIEITTERGIHRDFVVVLTTLSKYITLCIVGLLFISMFSGGSIDRSLSILFDVLFIYLGPWSLQSAAIEYYWEEELVLQL